MAEKNPQLLRYRKRSIWILAFYLPILIVPWVITCILMHRPVFLPSYINQRGEYSMTDMRKIQDWATAVTVLSRIAATLGLPIVSALMAQAVVVYSQLKKEGQETKLNVLQLFALSDRGWMDLPILWTSCFGGRSHSSRFLWLAAGLVLITTIQPPLQSLLVPYDPLTVITCNDQSTQITSGDKTCDKLGVLSRVVGIDPEPNIMELMPRTLPVNLIRQKMKTVSKSDVQPYLWHEDTTYERLPVEQQQAQSFAWIKANRDKDISYFASSLANGTTTGVLREHAMRINSTISCEEGPVPSTCSGALPFFTIFNHTGFATSGIKASVCVEGNHSAVPWTRSRDRQDITEHMWLSLEVAQGEDGRNADGQALLQDVTAFNLSCRASSTRGYFELGNHWNDQVFQPMLREWPSREDIRQNFNDHGSSWGDYKHRDRRPVTVEPAHDGPLSWDHPMNLLEDIGIGTPGPLALVALSLFGNGSFFHLASERPQKDMNSTMREICQSENYPFQRLSVENFHYNRLCTGGAGSSEYRQQYPPTGNYRNRVNYEVLPIFVARVLETFRHPEDAESLLDMGMFFANEVLLRESATVFGTVMSRSIYSSPGWTILKPRKTTTAIVVISTLIAVQAVCLLWLVWYIASTPTWTDRFDSFALAKLGTQLQGISAGGLTIASEKDTEYLGSQSGMVGLVGVEEGKQRASTDGTSETSDANVQDVEELTPAHQETESLRDSPILGLGGNGVLSSTYAAAGWFGKLRTRGKYAQVQGA